MILHVVYRSHGGENTKDRPSWYSKRLALLSFCRALEEARRDAVVEVTFLNDGPLPADRVELQRRWGTAVGISAGSNRRSYLHALALPRRRGWADDDLVLFAEDDYLWRPESLRALLLEASRRRADYLAPYGLGTHDPQQLPVPAGTWTGERVTPASDPLPAEAVRWHRHQSTTSTFAARVGALREDERLLVLCCLSGGDFDHTSCLALQGIPRFSALDVVRHHPGPEGSSPLRVVARAGYLALMRTAVDVRSLRRPSHRRTLLAADPPQATHMELAWLAAGDWEALATTTAEWDTSTTAR
ncbi:hypothetical protein [Kineococcus glutinatus]|uniref:Glycosyl transferase family 2 n=1 Tax=Kineococcus glutinatus TaxID=1070872 RepID=A0ABP9HWP5_9ACTN